MAINAGHRFEGNLVAHYNFICCIQKIIEGELNTLLIALRNTEEHRLQIHAANVTLQLWRQA